jgi:hypothetical protein
MENMGQITCTDQESLSRATFRVLYDTDGYLS